MNIISERKGDLVVGRVITYLHLHKSLLRLVLLVWPQLWVPPGGGLRLKRVSCLGGGRGT
jgi:hypothetical protein